MWENLVFVLFLWLVISHPIDCFLTLPYMWNCGMEPAETF